MLASQISLARLGVARIGGHFRAVAVRAVAPGETICSIVGVERERPTRYTIQVDTDRHVGPEDGATLETRIDSCAWLFLNHACLPNAALRGRDLVALHPIGAMDEVTFDYDTTEWELAEPFVCHCGHADCQGRLVRGFKHLTPSRRERLRPWLADHLARRLDEEAHPA